MKTQNIITGLIFFIIIAMLVIYWPKNTAPTVAEKINAANAVLPVIEKSPELSGLTNWINSEPIESIESLRGKVVLVDFWTYSCINCIRTFPYIQDLQEKYADKGLVILGIHAPEFAFEKIPANVKKAAEKYGLTYPIVQDNDFKTWKNFKNRFWPAKYLIDKEGNIRYTHFGEGEYIETENAVLELLGEEKIVSETENKKRFKKTPEIYLGTSRRENYAGFAFKKPLQQNQWTVFGSWSQNNEKIFSENIDDTLVIKMNVHAAEANLVLGGDATAKVYIDGKFLKEFSISENDLYNIFDFEKVEENYIDREVRIEFEGESIEAFAWTFG